MRVGVICEYSGIVRDAFRARGHDAISCDIAPSERPGPHRHGPAQAFDWSGYDLLICHPPCTFLAVSGNAWRKRPGRDQQTAVAVAFARWLWDLPCGRLCLENPVSVLSSKFRQPDQIIQPWQFGHGECKATCLWLRGLPKLRPVQVVAGRDPRVHRMPPGPDRQRERSRTYEGIAAAMADQWGSLAFAECLYA